MDNGGKKRKSEGTYVKDTRTKTMEGIECVRWGRVGQGRVMGEQ